MSNPKEFLAEYKQKVDRKLEELLHEELGFATDISEYSKESLKYLSEASLQGGKRIRPALMYSSYHLLEGDKKFDQEIIKATAALELLHMYLLAIDDVFDKSDFRRGSPTIHKRFESYLESKFSNKEFDKEHVAGSLGITVGLIASHIGQKLISSLQIDSEKVIRALQTYNEHYISTAHGEIHDIVYSYDKTRSEEEILKMLYFKSGLYTFETPLHLGAILAGASEEDLSILSEYATNVGLAFQLQDDILGMFGEEDVTGKPADGDLKEGKQTILTVHAYENGSDEEKDLLQQMLGNQEVTREELEEVRKVLKDTGAYDYTKSLAKSYVEKAYKAIEKMNKWNNDSLKFLDGLAHYMIDRDL